MMRNLFTTTLALLLMTCAAAVAQQQTFKKMRSLTSGVEYEMSNYGIFGHDISGNDPGLFYPSTGQRLPYLYGSGVWFGATKMVGDSLRKLAFIGYNPNSGGSWATPGEADTNNREHGLFYSGHFDRASGAYTGPGVENTWPLWARPGMEITPRTPGVYVTDVASRNSSSAFTRPAFMPNVGEQFVVRYHDGDLGRYEGFGSDFGFPIGLQFQQSVYSWQPSTDYGSAVVIQYEVINVSGDTLRDCVIGQASDPDLGAAGNDRVAIYRGQDNVARAGITTTEAETGRTYLALAQVLLEAPAIGDNSFIDNSLRPSQLGMHEIHAWRNWKLENDPITIAERYDFMLGPSQDGDDGPGDKRTMLAARPFDMAPGDTAHFSIAFAVVSSPWGIANDGGKESGLASASPTATRDLDELMSRLLEDYSDGQFTPSQSTSAVDLDLMSGSAMTVAPNPAIGTTSLSFTLGRAADVAVSLVDALGERVSTTSLGELGAGSHRTTIDLDGIGAGAYMVVVEAGAERGVTRLTIAR